MATDIDLDLIVNSIVTGSYSGSDAPDAKPIRPSFGTKSKYSLSGPGAKLYFADVTVTVEDGSVNLDITDGSLTDYFGNELRLVRIFGLYVEVLSGPMANVSFPGDDIDADNPDINIKRSLLLDIGEPGDLLTTSTILNISNNGTEDGLYRVAVWGSEL